MKYVVNIICILLVVFLVFSIINLKNKVLTSDSPTVLKIKNLWQQVLVFFKIQKQNVSVEITPPKNRPLTMIEKETYLRMFAPDTFGKFSDEEWKEFWKIIYGPTEEKQGKFKLKRYKSKDEIEAELIQKYPNPFAFMRREHWKIFWQDILNIIWVDEEEQEVGK